MPAGTERTEWEGTGSKKAKPVPRVVDQRAGYWSTSPENKCTIPEPGLVAKKMPGITMKLSSRKYFEELEWVGAQGLKWSLDHLPGA
jgi:hypothetical protein